ncbi:MAG: serine hydroxymethyltransferase [Candidatus Spechtbacteria bacterium]|nr:serine hydroxymethyltransferase [Candidatus Spechtbacteria bacterium]
MQKLTLKLNDKELEKLNAAEEKKQSEYINLIASENYMSPAVRMALSSVTANKYAEGYPGARYYPGCDEAIDPIERLTQDRALKAMKLSPKVWEVNVQPYSGSPANLEVLGALVKPKGHPDGADTVLGMALPVGGHLTHGHPVSFTGKFFNFVQYGLDTKGIINYDQIEKLAGEHKPRLIICGATAYSQKIDFKRFSEIAKKHGALLMADIAHIAGLVAGGVHPSPFPYCDVVTTTTHKTLRGPRGAMIFARKELMPAINKAVFPGMQGGPHNNNTLAIGVAFGEIMKPAFKTYAKQIVKNASVLAKELKKRNFTLVSGGTQNHLMLIDLQTKSVSGNEAQKILYSAGIIANRNSIPNDPRKPFDPSGIRMGTPALTTRGFKEKEILLVAQWIDEAISDPTAKNCARIKKRVQTLCKKFPPPGF